MTGRRSTLLSYNAIYIRVSFHAVTVSTRFNLLARSAFNGLSCIISVAQDGGHEPQSVTDRNSLANRRRTSRLHPAYGRLSRLDCHARNLGSASAVSCYSGSFQRALSFPCRAYRYAPTLSGRYPASGAALRSCPALALSLAYAAYLFFYCPLGAMSFGKGCTTTAVHQRGQKGDSILLNAAVCQRGSSKSRLWGQGRDSNPRLTAYEAVLEPSPVTLSYLIRTGFSQRSGSNRRRLVLRPPQPRRRKKGGIHNLHPYYNSFCPFCQYGKTELYAKKALQTQSLSAPCRAPYKPDLQDYRLHRHEGSALQRKKRADSS